MSDQPPADRVDRLLAMRQALAPGADDKAAQFLRFCEANVSLSKAQLFQDLLVLFFLKEKRGGFFVEFGAADGVKFSNTYLLENGYGWTGILAEPALCWHDALRQNRNAAIDFRCVWTETGRRLEFIEPASAGLSTLSEFSGRDYHREKRRTGKKYLVETVSLNDLLADHKSPRAVDYLSIDTEGSELAILKAFDFTRYAIHVLTVEHNHIASDRAELHNLLKANGFIRVFEAFSRFDDWYVNRSLV